MLKIPGGLPSDCSALTMASAICCVWSDSICTGKMQRLLGDEVAEAVSDAGNRRRVIGQHSKSEGDHQDQVGELGEVEAAEYPCERGQGGLDAKPDNQDHRQATEDVESRGLDRSAPGRKQLGDGLLQET